MKLFGYTVIHNEELYIPIIMPYIERMGYDKFVVYDNESTDNSVEILKQYPFVEIRPLMTDGHFSDYKKRDIQLSSYVECYQYGKNNDEQVWMTFTDFDEVIFMTREREKTVKEYLEWQVKKGYNVFDGRFLHITSDKDTFNKDNLKNGLLPHQLEGSRATWWLSEGKKPTLILATDFEYMETTCGNHSLGAKIEEGKKVLNLDDTKEFYNLHFKYFSKDLLRQKAEAYAKHDGKNLILVNEVNEACDRARTSSFTFEQLFLMNGFFAKPLITGDGFGDGFYLVN